MKQPTLCWPPETRVKKGKREDETEKNEMEEPINGDKSTQEVRWKERKSREEKPTVGTPQSKQKKRQGWCWLSARSRG